MEENFESLDLKHRQFIQQSFDEKIKNLLSSINTNHEFLCKVVERHVSQKPLQTDVRNKTPSLTSEIITSSQKKSIAKIFQS